MLDLKVGDVVSIRQDDGNPIATTVRFFHLYGEEATIIGITPTSHGITMVSCKIMTGRQSGQGFLLPINAFGKNIKPVVKKRTTRIIRI